MSYEVQKQIRDNSTVCVRVDLCWLRTQRTRTEHNCFVFSLMSAVNFPCDV